MLPIGGLKEKLLAAKNAGIKTVLVPKENETDVEEISAEIPPIYRPPGHLCISLKTSAESSRFLSCIHPVLLPQQYTVRTCEFVLLGECP